MIFNEIIMYVWIKNNTDKNTAKALILKLSSLLYFFVNEQWR